MNVGLWSLCAPGQKNLELRFLLVRARAAKYPNQSSCRSVPRVSQRPLPAAARASSKVHRGRHRPGRRTARAVERCGGRQGARQPRFRRDQPSRARRSLGRRRRAGAAASRRLPSSLRTSPPPPPARALRRFRFSIFSRLTISLNVGEWKMRRWLPGHRSASPTNCHRGFR